MNKKEAKQIALEWIVANIEAIVIGDGILQEHCQTSLGLNDRDTGKITTEAEKILLLLEKMTTKKGVNK